MPHRYLAIFGATLLALFSMTAGAATPPPVKSGIEGLILVSPSRPGPITKDGPSVAPVRNTKFLVQAGNATVTSFTTDGEGRFQVVLPPGHYVILKEGSGAVRIGSWRFEADVVAGAMTKVNWTADSGMR